MCENGLSRNEIISIYESSHLQSEFFNIHAVTVAYVAGLAALHEELRLTEEVNRLAAVIDTLTSLQKDENTVTVVRCRDCVHAAKLYGCEDMFMCMREDDGGDTYSDEDHDGDYYCADGDSKDG